MTRGQRGWLKRKVRVVPSPGARNELRFCANSASAVHRVENMGKRSRAQDRYHQIQKWH